MAIIKTLSTTEELASAAANRMLELAHESVTDHGIFTVALSGGSTPLPTYELLARPPFSEQMPWEYVHIFWGDERAVPPNHENSNYRMAHEVFIDPLGLPEQNVHRIKGENQPQQAAEAYEQDIRDLVGGQPPSFDLVLLGLGEDGHTASLFPNTTAITSPTKHRLVMANYIDKLDSWRITFTPRTINAARHVLFLVSGKNKAEPVYRVLAGRHDPEAVPAQVVNPSNGTLSWYLDREAAAYLHSA